MRTALFAPLARAAFPVPSRAAFVRRRDDPPSGERRAAAAREIVDGPERIDEMVVFPVHPRTRARMHEERPRARRSHSHDRAASYLELASLASQARVIVTDSGGLQKEAYWYGVPCVTVRPSTEWVDTVAVGANVLVDADRERSRRGGRRGVDARLTRRFSTATDTPPSGSPRCSAATIPRR